jgi:site-specific DNA recombinase
MAQEIPAPHGGNLWSCATIRCILTNPVYTGSVWAGRRGQVRQIKQRRSPPALTLGKKANGSITHQPQTEWILVGQVPAVVSEE